MTRHDAAVPCPEDGCEGWVEIDIDPIDRSVGVMTASIVYVSQCSSCGETPELDEQHDQLMEYLVAIERRY